MKNHDCRRCNIRRIQNKLSLTYFPHFVQRCLLFRPRFQKQLMTKYFDMRQQIHALESVNTILKRYKSKGLHKNWNDQYVENLSLHMNNHHTFSACVVVSIGRFHFCTRPKHYIVINQKLSQWMKNIISFNNRCYGNVLRFSLKVMKNNLRWF